MHFQLKRVLITRKFVTPTKKETKMNISLGTRSVHKLAAVERACRELEINATILGVEAHSGENAQPRGFEETFNGALTRATSAKDKNPDSIAIGIESGIFYFGVELDAPIVMDIAIIVVLGEDGKRIVTTSEGIQFPIAHVKTAKVRGFNKTTVGEIIAEHMGGSPKDPHSTMTGGKVSREMTLVDALKVALRQL